MNKNNAQSAIGQPCWQSLGLPDLKSLKQRYASVAPDIHSSAKNLDGAVEVMRKSLGISAGGKVSFLTYIGNVIIIDSLIPHIVEKREDARERYADFIIPTLTQPLEIWKVNYDDESFRYRFIKLFDAKYDLMLVANVRDDGVILWNLIQRDTKGMDKLRVGELLYSEYDRKM